VIDLELALADCLDRLERGLALEDCLARYPDHAAELRSLLGLAEELRVVGPLRAPPAARAAGWARLQAAMAEGAAAPARRPTAGRQVAAAAVAALFLLALTGTGFAAAQASPTDRLYSVKTAFEEVRIATAPSDSTRAELYLDRAAQRLHELETLPPERRADIAPALLDSYRDAVQKSRTSLETAQGQGADVAPLRARLERELAGQQAALDRFVPPPNSATPPNSTGPAGGSSDGGRPASAPSAPSGPPPLTPSLPLPVPVVPSAGGASGELPPRPTLTLPGGVPLPTVTLPPPGLGPTLPTLPSGLPVLSATPPATR
jgi:hypothetical protein